MLSVLVAATTAIFIFGRTRATIRTTNTFFAALLCFINIESRQANNYHKNCYNNEIFHF